MVLDAESVVFLSTKTGDNTYVLAIFFEYRAEEYEMIRKTYEKRTKQVTKELRTNTKHIRNTYESN